MAVLLPDTLDRASAKRLMEVSAVAGWVRFRGVHGIAVETKFEESVSTAGRVLWALVLSDAAGELHSFKGSFDGPMPKVWLSLPSDARPPTRYNREEVV